MNRTAFELQKCIGEMLAQQVKTPDRDLAVAITYAQTAKMWLNRYVFSTVGQPAKSADSARSDPVKVGPTFPVQSDHAPLTKLEK